MAGLNIVVREEGSRSTPAVLALDGEVDPRTKDKLKKQLDMLGGDIVHVILDMSNTEYVNSSALAILVKFAERLRKQQGSVSCTNVNTRVRTPFEMLGLLVFFRFYDSVDEAKAAVAAAAE